MTMKNTRKMLRLKLNTPHKRISWALETLTEFKAREPDMIADIISSRSGNQA